MRNHKSKMGRVSFLTYDFLFQNKMNNACPTRHTKSVNVNIHVNSFL